MLLSARRSYLRYLLVVALLVVVYVLLLPYDNVPIKYKGSAPASPEKPQQEPKAETEAEKQKQKQQIEEERRKKFQQMDKSAADMRKQEAQGKNTGVAVDNSHTPKEHYQRIFEILNKHWPNVQRLDNYKDGKKASKKAFDDKYPIFSNKELGDFLQVSSEDLEKLKMSHQGTVRDLPDTYPEGMYKGRGIVTVAGGALMPVLVTTMKLLRKVSPHIPVEIFVADSEEYEPEICEQVLPAINVKCRVLKDIYGEDLWKRFDIHGYQLKVLSMLASSFEDNLFLDADSIPLVDIEPVFDQEPYKSHKYVLWPDFWFRTTSPRFYDIAGVKLGKRVRGDLSVTDPDLTPQADLEGALPDKSTESGQILFNKKKHYKALLLAMYYNLNGYNIFYPLLSQGSGGEGDKETFLAALEVLKHDYYAVKTDVRPAGHFDENNNFQGKGMLQALPFDDYKVNVLKSSTAVSRILFMHLNYPKINPRDLFHSDIFAQYYKDDASRVRFYGKPSGNYWVFDYKDIELEMWQEHEWLACDVGVKKGIKFKDWVKHDADLADLCKRTQDHVKWLKSTHDT